MGLDLKSPLYSTSESARSCLCRMRECLSDEYEFQIQQGFLYLPIILAAGIALYFALPSEPPLVVGAFALVATFMARQVFVPRYSALLNVLFIITLGFAAGQVRTTLVYTAVVQKEIGPAVVMGTVTEIEDLGEGEGARLVLSDLEIEGLNYDQTPRKIRLKSRVDKGLLVGQRIKALSKIHPPSAPLIPGGFDFQRHLYFKGIGGVGFIYKGVEIMRDVSRSGFRQRVEGLRQNIAMRVEQAMKYPEAGMATALMIGRKSAIAEEDKEAMRASGLAHMLAISGLHVGLFSGALFFIVRLLLACLPGMALRYPIKKYAAVTAIVGALGYMFIAGASIPTQRAMMMTGIVFAAIILDRSPVSLRLVAFAAFVVLLFFPESLLSASFHMSFAAVTGLIAFYDWLRPHWSRWHRQTGITRRAGLYFLGVCLTTVIATITTAPFALFHFHQLAAFGVIGNLIAVPLLAFVIMPSVLLSFFLMPFGLEFLPLYVTEFGVASVLDIAHWVEALPHSVFRVSMLPDSSIIFLVLSALILILMRGSMRLLCLVPLMASVIALLGHSAPDVLVSRKSKLIAVRDDSGAVHFSSFTSDRFVRESWSDSYGLKHDQIHKWPSEGELAPVRCDEVACRIEIEGKVVSYIKDQSTAKYECENVDIAIADFPLRTLCGWNTNTKLIDYVDTRDHGAHAIWLRGSIIEIKSTESVRGDRAWGGFNALYNRR